MKKISIIMMLIVIGTLCGCKNPAQIVATQGAAHVAKKAVAINAEANKEKAAAEAEKVETTK